MKPLIAALLAILIATPALATAGERDLDVMQAAVQAAIDARGTEDYDAALDELHALAIDEAATPACRTYADVMLAGLLLMDAAERYPGNETTVMLFGLVVDYAPTARNDCLLSV